MWLSRMLLLSTFLLLTPSSTHFGALGSPDKKDGLLGAAVGAVVGAKVGAAVVKGSAGPIIDTKLKVKGAKLKAGGALALAILKNPIIKSKLKAGGAKLKAKGVLALATLKNPITKAKLKAGGAKLKAGAKIKAGGALALAIIKGIIITQNLPFFVGLHVGKKVAKKLGKRDVSTQEQFQLVDDALELANQADSGDCIAKILCHLEALPEKSLSDAAITLKKALGNVNKSDYLNVKTSHGMYGLATAVGGTLGKSYARTCDMMFQTCPLDHNELLDVLNSTFTC